MDESLSGNEFTLLCTDIDCVADGLLSIDFEQTLSQEQQLILHSKLQDLVRSMRDFEDLGFESLF